MKELVGITKKLDELRRVTIPIEYLRNYGIEKFIEIIPTQDGILIRSPLYTLVKRSEINKILLINSKEDEGGFDIP